MLYRKPPQLPDQTPIGASNFIGEGGGNVLERERQICGHESFITTKHIQVYFGPNISMVYYIDCYSVNHGCILEKFIILGLFLIGKVNWVVPLV